MFERQDSAYQEWSTKTEIDEENEIKRRTKTAPETPIIPSEFPIRAVFCVLKLKFKIKSECTNNKLMFLFSYRPAAVPVIEQYEICIKKLLLNITKKSI